jgi:molybdenum cofactor cytidylyltransferase
MIPGGPDDVQSGSPRIAAVVVASGRSVRFGSKNKLLMPVRGEALVRRVVRAYVEASLSPVILVVGYDGAEVARAASGLSLEIVDNPDYQRGMSRSIVQGVQALAADVEAVVLGVADQARLTSGTVSAVAKRFLETGAPVAAARYGGQPASPVLFHRSLFGELLSLSGDRGGRSVVEVAGEAVAWVDFENAALGMDVDTPDDYATLADLD